MMFNTILSEDDFIDNGGFFFLLGTNDTKNIDPNRCLCFPTPDNDALIHIQNVDFNLYKDGVNIIINKDIYAKYKQSIDAIQKYLAFFYCKYILFPSVSTTIPDEQKVRKNTKKPVLIPREIQKIKNLKQYLKYPIADKLRDANINLPVTVVLPGPSLARSTELLQIAKKKSIIVCVPRSLEFCKEHGVEPDFVVNLDTDPRNKFLVNSGTKMESTYLVSLVPGPEEKVDDYYRGAFFMNSFHTGVIKNDFRLLESWLSCSISTIGLADVLNAPQVFILGGDHSWESSDETTKYHYWNSAAKKTHSTDYPSDFPIIASNLDQTGNNGKPTFDTFQIPDRAGKKVFTFFHYYSIAIELEYVAAEISSNKNTQFYNLIESGILSPQIFKKEGIKVLCTLKDINREGLIQKIDAAMEHKEIVNWDKLNHFLKSTIDKVSTQKALIEYFYTEKMYDELNKIEYIKNIKELTSKGKYHLIDEKYSFAFAKTRLTIKLCKVWLEELNKAKQYVNLLRHPKAIYFCTSLKELPYKLPYDDYFIFICYYASLEKVPTIPKTEKIRTITDYDIWQIYDLFGNKNYNLFFTEEFKNKFSDQYQLIKI